MRGVDQRSGGSGVPQACCGGFDLKIVNLAVVFALAMGIAPAYANHHEDAKHGAAAKKHEASLETRTLRSGYWAWP